MVSNASDDLPLPLGPVTTVNFPSGRSRSITLRLFWRAPRISTQSFGDGVIPPCFFLIFEPTGKSSRLRSGSQILDSKACVIPNEVRALTDAYRSESAI